MASDSLNEMVRLPLAGLTVLDFSQFLAGPSAALRLADLGARVIKVERPDGGDASRSLYLADLPFDQDSALFHAINRGKQSLTADLKNADDLMRVKALIAQADVLIHNFRPGIMDRLGLGWDDVRAINTRFDIFDNNITNNNQPCEVLSDCGPAANVIKDLVKDDKDKWVLPDEQFSPIARNGAYNPNSTYQSGAIPDSMGLPRDLCHYGSYNASCFSLTGGAGDIGNGEWARQDYFSKYHPGRAPRFPGWPRRTSGWPPGLPGRASGAGRPAGAR
mgnify:CR=1 FL=1